MHGHVTFTVPLKCNVALARLHVARCMLEVHICHLKYANSQLKNHSTLGLQQNIYKARLFNSKLYGIKPFIIVSTHHHGCTHVSRNLSTLCAQLRLASCFFVEIM